MLNPTVFTFHYPYALIRNLFYIISKVLNKNLSGEKTEMSLLLFNRSF